MLILPNLLYISPNFNITGSIAIVGSSGSLKNSGLGNIIDGYDVVIRFNRAPTVGYENDVGQKTSLRVCNLAIFLNRKMDKNDRKLWSGQPRNFINKLENSNILLYYGSFENEWNEGKEKIESKGNVPYRLDHKRALKHINKNVDCDSPLSVGVGFILLTVLSGFVPTLFGFDTCDKERDHYWETRPGAGPIHNIKKEYEIINKLVDDEKVKIYR